MAAKTSVLGMILIFLHLTVVSTGEVTLGKNEMVSYIPDFKELTSKVLKNKFMSPHKLSEIS